MLKTGFGFDLPRRLQIEFSEVVQHHSEDDGGEVDATQLWELFTAEYFKRGIRLRLAGHTPGAADAELDGCVHRHTARDAHSLADALDRISLTVRVLTTSAQPLDGAWAVYAECVTARKTCWGVRVHQNETFEALKAVVSAVDRAISADPARATRQWGA